MDNQPTMCCPHQIIIERCVFILVWNAYDVAFVQKPFNLCACVCAHICRCNGYAWYIKPEPIRIDRLTKRNLNEFSEILQSDCPLFCVSAVLSTPHIALQPTGVEVCNTITQVVNGFLERYNSHKRFSNFSSIDADEVEQKKPIKLYQ